MRGILAVPLAGTGTLVTNDHSRFGVLLFDSSSGLHRWCCLDGLALE
jgi:hypothetical protein